MAIAFDTVTSSTASSFSHTVSGSERILFVAIRSSANTVSAVSYAGNAMTQLATVAVPGDGQIYIYYRIAPTLGANTVAITGGAGLTVRAVSYTGAKQSGVPDASATNSSSATISISQSITTVANNTWSIAFMRNDADQSDDNSGGIATRRGTASSIAYFDSNSPKTPAGSITGNFKTTGGGTANWGLIVASFAPSSTTYTLAMGVGTYLISGQSITINKFLRMTMATGSYVITGQTALLKRTYLLAMSVGSYLITGFSANLSFRGWSNVIKNLSTATNTSKNSSSWTNRSKNTS